MPAGAAQVQRCTAQGSTNGLCYWMPRTVSLDAGASAGFPMEEISSKASGNISGCMAFAGLRMAAMLMR